MKKALSLSLLALFLMTLAVLPSSGQTVQDILKKMVEAQGGKVALESIKDMTALGTIDIVQQGLSGNITLYKKEPDKRRMDVEVMGMVITQAYDGQTAWGTNFQTGATEVLTGDQEAELKRNSMPMVSILNPEKYGISFVYKGKEKIEDKEYLVLEETFPDGFKATIYVDPGNYLPYKVKAKTASAMGGEIEVEQYSSDYRKVDGLIIAYSIVTYTEGQEYLKITLSKVSFNTGLEDSLFKMQ